MKIIYYILLLLNILNKTIACENPANSTLLYPSDINNCSWICDIGYSNINNSCIIKSSIYDPYIVNPIGLEILEVYYNISCLLHGCWTINFQYTKNTNANIVLYLPNNNINNINFPCNNYNLSSISSTSCCLTEFVRNYHTISTFKLPYNNTCDILNQVSLYKEDNIYGKFESMPISLVQNYINTNSIIKTGTILLDNNELIASNACIFTGTLGIYEQYELFIGLAEFIPTNTRILETTYNQVRLLLTKTDYFTFSSYGNNKYTYLNYINVKINNIYNNINSYYASVSFTIDNNFNLKDIPINSIIVNYNNIRYNPCNIILSSEYLSSFNLLCSPVIKLCVYDVINNYVNINIPIIEIDINSKKDLYLNFIVLVNDNINNNIVETTFNTGIPIISSGITNWCLTKTSKTDIIEFIESINLIIGIADNIKDYNNLKTYNNIQTNISKIESINSKSIESGLITLILKGQESYFNLIGNSEYSLDLQDVYTLHITNINKYNDVIKLFNITVPFNIININNYPTLEPTIELLNICNTISNPFPESSCVIKHDIKSTILSSTAYQLNNNIDKTLFIESIFNIKNNYIENLSNNYSSLIIDKYEITNKSKKYRKAYWINPGFNWIRGGINQEDRFILSQWIIIISLININQNSTLSRRLLNINTKNSNYNIEYGITPENIMALNLNIDTQYITTWNIQMLLTNIEACYDKSTLYNNTYIILNKYITECASPYLELGIVSIIYDTNNINCINNKRNIENIISSIQFILAFKNTNNIYFDIQKFINNPNIKSIQSVNILPNFIKSYNNINSNNNINNNLYLLLILLILLMIPIIILIKTIIYIRRKNNNNEINEINGTLVFITNKHEILL